jgi:hypothetical protein
MTDFAVFDDKKDQRFREQRRAKAASRPCPACRRKIYEERLVQEEKMRQEKAQRRAEAGEKQSQTVTPPPKPAQPERRLPHGSAFHVTYDASKTEWQGSLVVPDKGEFTATASGVFRLLRQLDDQYWKSVRPPDATP